MPRDVSDYKDKNGVTSKSEKTIEFDFTFSRLENWIFFLVQGGVRVHNDDHKNEAIIGKKPQAS